MASIRGGQASSGSDGDPQIAVIDDKKRKRMISNRESAKRSRMKKQQRLDELIAQVSQLQNENSQIMQRVNATTHLYATYASDNNVLKAQVVELTNRLRSLNEVLYIAEEVSGLAMDIPEIPDPMLEPWQLPCPVPSIMASSNMFQC